MTSARCVPKPGRKLLAASFLLAGLAIPRFTHGARSRDVRRERLDALPRVMLWAWERPEDLRFLQGTGAGVSFLAETVILGGGEVTVRPRLQTLKTAPGTPLMGCARIETDRSQPPALSETQSATVSSAISRLGSLANISAVQVDFDATASERPFYARVLRDLRHDLPPSMPLSITALTSWCTGDPWIAGLPIDEAVPMLFRMGPDARNIRLRLEEGRDFTPDVCRESVGISTDEKIRNLPAGRRVYVFSPEGWSPQGLRAALAEIKP